ncbi:tape measure protein [Streptococcus hyointestinalis]|uniref:tape measure protein n=1 Tax=Streptococcus hyointestinalis TaxID=1337 RepID=UPI0013DEAAC4|nr:tape measure protein [Streptococcus hyointestinalis]
MAKKIQAQMSTEIALDLVKASQSVRNLTSVVNSATNAWKAQEAQLKAVGDYTKAAETKYQGLGNAIEAQKAKIENLKQKQSELKGNTTETAGEYLKYQQQIDQATTRLASMEAQQTKAKQSMDYYKSGLADLQKSYKAQNELSESNVKRLQAEGKENEALQAKATGLKSTISNLSKQYEVQERMLGKVAKESGTASEAYQKQKTRLNETATAMANAKREQDKLNDELKKLNEHPTLIQRLKEKMQGLGKETEETGEKANKTGSIFKSVFSANILSSALMNGLGTAKSLFSDLLQQGNEYIRYQEVMTASWTTLTGSAKEGKVMVDMTNDMAQAASNSAQMVDELNKKIYAVTHNADDTKQLTNTILTLQDAFGVADDAVQNFATQWGQMLGNGKVQAQDMLSFMNVFPTIKQEMIGVISEMKGGAEITNAAFAEMQKNGEVTSEIANKALQRMGEKYKDATKNFANTTEGLERTIKGRGPALIAAVEAPFMKMKNPLLAKASEWISSDETKNKFTHLGEVASKGLDKVVDSFKKVFNLGDKGNVMNDIMDKFTGYVEKLSNSIAVHAPEIAQFAKNAVSGVGSVASIAKSLGEGVWAVAKDTIGFIADGFALMSGNSKKSKKSVTGLAGGLKEIAKHKEALKAVGMVIATYFIATKVINGFQSLYKGLMLAKSGFEAVKVAFATNPFGMIALAVTTVVVALVELYKHNKTFKKFVDNIIKACADFFKGVGKWFGQAFKTMGNFFKGVGKFFSNFGKGISKMVKATTDGVGKVVKFFGNIIKTVVNFGTIVMKILVFSNPFVLGFALMYKHVKPFRDFINGLIKGAKDLYDGFKKFFGAAGKFIGDTFDGIKKGVGKTYNATAKIIGDVSKSISKGWNDTWKAASDFLGSTWDTMKKKGKDGVEGLKKLLSPVVDSIGKKFSDTWDAIKKGFGSMWDGLKDLAGNGINAVIKIPNAGIDGINSLIESFGGSKNAIKKIPKVKFAEGTGAFEGISRVRRPITRPTLALLNDGNDSPETGNQETVIFPNGNVWQPQGRNVSAILPAGTEVLNAFETRLLSSLGNQVPFKSGTGFWSKIWNTATDVAGNVWDGIKDTVTKFTKMLGYIADAVKDPVGTLAKKFNPKADKLDGLFNPLGNALFKTPINEAKNWWKELWGMAQSAADEGSSVAMGAVGDDYPAKWKNMAKDAIADPWGYFIRECVSFVANRLNNWGVNPAKFSHLGNGADWVSARVPHMSKPKAGSVAVYAPGSQFPNHVAIVSSVNGDRYSGEEYNQSGDGKYHTFANRLASQATTFLDFGVRGGSSDDDNGSDSAKKANSPLQRLIKSQVGGMFDWIKKFLAPETDSEPSGGGGTGVERWRSTVIKALKKNGLPATDHQVTSMLQLIQRESNGNPTVMNDWDINARNGNPSIGLTQTTVGTFNAHAFPGHKNIRNGYDNLLASIHYIISRYGSSDAAFTRVAKYAYANGGLVSQHGIYELAENNKPEYVIPTDIARRSRAWQLLAEVVGNFIGDDDSKFKKTSDDDSALSKLENKLDTMITLLSQLVANGQQPVEIRNIIDGQGVSNGLAPYMTKAQEAYDKRMAILRGERGEIL